MSGFRSLRTGVLMTAGLALAASSPAQEGEAARFAGVWIRNDALSQQWAPKIDFSLGPARPGSRPKSETILPRSGNREPERQRLRALLEAAAEAVQEVEIESAPGELTVVTVDENLRRFYLTRKHVRQRADGVKVEVEARWDGDDLVLVQRSDDGLVFTETFSYDAANDRLAHVLTVQHALFDEPFVVRTVFDRAPDGE